MPRNLFKEARKEVTWAVMANGGVRVKVGIWVWLLGGVMVVEEQRRSCTSRLPDGALVVGEDGEEGEIVGWEDFSRRR